MYPLFAYQTPMLSPLSALPDCMPRVLFLVGVLKPMPEKEYSNRGILLL